MRAEGFSAGTLPLVLFLLALLLTIVILGLRSLLLIRKRMAGSGNSPTGDRQQPMEFVVGTFQQLVTQLKEKERELEELRSRAEQKAEHFASYSEDILQSVPSGVITFDVEGRIVTVNRAARHILNVSPEELLGHTASVLGVATADILNEPAAGRREMAFTTRDGRRLWLGFFVSDLVGPDDHTLGRIMGFTDLTEVRRLREKIELRERLTHLGEVSAGIAHEIRNPMAVIAGYAQILDGRSDLDESARATVRSIRKEIDGINRVISDFLQFARPTQPRLERVDVSVIAEEAVETWEPNRTDLERRMDLQPHAWVRGDDVLLRQCFLNLIKNATESMSGGGRLAVRSFIRDDRVILEVSDTGPGIPEEIRDRVFLPFVTSKDVGTGLGLAIVHKIVVLHEGTIDVESGEVGTTFRIVFPALREA